MESNIYTVNGKEFELQHHGVKGMKWGVRKKIEKYRDASADRGIRRAKTNKDHAKLEFNLANANATARYSSPKKQKKLIDAKAQNKAAYDISVIDNNYAIARQKARKDKSYKNSSEYLKAKKAYGEGLIQHMLYGHEGRQRIHTLQNKGKTKEHATLEVAVEQTLATVGALAITTLIAATARR